MGVEADNLTEQGIDALILHMANECGGICPICMEEAEFNDRDLTK